MRILAPVLLLACATSAFAADMNVDDLRFGAGFLSKTFSGGGGYSVTQNGGSVSSSSAGNPASSDAHSNYRGEIQYMSGHLGDVGGFLIGVDLAVNQARFTSPNAQARYTTPVADLNLGYGYALTSRWDIELTALGGLGWTMYHISGPNATSTNSSSHYVEYGARIATYFELTTSCEVGVEIPYLVGAFHPSYSSSSNNGTTVHVSDHERNRGLGILVQIGFRL